MIAIDALQETLRHFSGYAAAKTLFKNATSGVIEWRAPASTDVSDFTEAAQDAVGAMVTNSSKVSLTYVDATPSLTADIVAGSLGAADIANRTRKLGFDLGAGFLSAGTGAISYSSGVRISFPDAEEGQRDWARETPSDFASGGVLKILWETPATGSLNARFRLAVGQAGDAEVVAFNNMLDSTFDSPIDGTANQLQLSSVALSGTLVNADKRISVTVIRQGNHANDTVSNVVYLRAVWLDYTADS